MSIYFASVPFDRFTIAFHMNENVFFTRMVDSLVEMSSNDPELADGIKWLDNQAFKAGIVHPKGSICGKRLWSTRMRV